MIVPVLSHLCLPAFLVIILAGRQLNLGRGLLTYSRVYGFLWSSSFLDFVEGIPSSFSGFMSGGFPPEKITCVAVKRQILLWLLAPFASFSIGRRHLFLFLSGDWLVRQIDLLLMFFQYKKVILLDSFMGVTILPYSCRLISCGVVRCIGICGCLCLLGSQIPIFSKVYGCLCGFRIWMSSVL